jgi:hypothetical protein
MQFAQPRCPGGKCYAKNDHCIETDEETKKRGLGDGLARGWKKKRRSYRN